MRLIEYSESSRTVGGFEFFGTVVDTTGGQKNYEYRYKWYGNRFFIQDRSERLFDLYDLWSDFVKEVNSAFEAWVDLRIYEIKPSSDGFWIDFYGYRTCYQEEIDRYNKLQEQVPDIMENKRKAELAKVNEAKENYERLLIRYKNVYEEYK